MLAEILTGLSGLTEGVQFLFTLGGLKNVVMLLIASGALPPLDSRMVFVSLEPKETVPKSTDDGETSSLGCT